MTKQKFTSVLTGVTFLHWLLSLKRVEAIQNSNQWAYFLEEDDYSLLGSGRTPANNHWLLSLKRVEAIQNSNQGAYFLEEDDYSLLGSGRTPANNHWLLSLNE